MTIKGPRLADSDTAQAFLADMADRRQHVPQAIDGALDRLAALPVGDWKPQASGTVQDRIEQTAAIAEVYVRGLLACGLVVDAACGRDIFYTAKDFAVRGERIDFATAYGDITLGVLARAYQALTAARTVFVFLEDYPFFDGFHDGHLEVLLHLTELAHTTAAARLRESKEGE